MMKKTLILLVALLCTTGAFAQFTSVNNNYNAKHKSSSIDGQWTIGLRLGDTGMQAVSEYLYSDNKHIEARFGMVYNSRMYFYSGWYNLGYIGGLCADFSMLHYWNCANWDWTPDTGDWFLDAGAGINIGGAKNYVYAGVAGSVKFGINFRNIPLRVTVDYTPVFGPAIAYGMQKNYGFEKNTYAKFFTTGLYNFGVTATYCF